MNKNGYTRDDIPLIRSTYLWYAIVLSVYVWAGLVFGKAKVAINIFLECFGDFFAITLHCILSRRLFRKRERGCGHSLLLFVYVCRSAKLHCRSLRCTRISAKICSPQQSTYDINIFLHTNAISEFSFASCAKRVVNGYRYIKVRLHIRCQFLC